VLAFAGYIIVVATLERVLPIRVVRFYQKYIANPVSRWAAGVLPGWAVIETTGRRTGLRRRTPVGGRLRGDTYWFISGNAGISHYVWNIKANPQVRVRVHGRWRPGIAHLLPEDDVNKRMWRLNLANSLFVRIASRDPMTIRIDLEPRRRG
jgi:deazaflavin-dependent oxidoreductase (nitroreductase family)